jgi:hypothetical protein
MMPVRGVHPGTIDLMIRLQAIALCLGLTACTTVSDEKEVISAFSTATGTATQALKSYDAATAARETAKIRARAVADPDGVVTVDEQNKACTLKSKQCQVSYQGKEDSFATPLTIPTIIPNHIVAAEAITAYAGALKEVADADATPQVAAALDKAVAAASSLSALVNPESGPGVRALAAPSANALAWLFGKYQEEIKLNALRDATQKMNPIIQEAVGKFFGEEARLAVEAAKAANEQALNNSIDAFEKTPTTETINAVAAAGAAFDQQLKAPAQMVFTRLAETHQMITTALVERPKSLKDIYTALNRLIADAVTLSGIAQELKAAASTPSSESQ